VESILILDVHVAAAVDAAGGTLGVESLETTADRETLRA
jgi:hypothetical protein